MMGSDDENSGNEHPHSAHDSPASSVAKSKYPSCDFCRRLKIKCERQRDAEQCHQCIARDAVCTTTIKPKKPRAKRQDHLFSIENRIRQMESVIAAKLEGPGSLDPDAMEQGDFSKQVGISDNLSMVVVNEQGGSQFLGSSSGFSLFSPRGLQWISKKTGNQNLERLIMQIRQLDPGTWDHGSWSRFLNVAWHPLPEGMREPIPTREIALQYVEQFFSNFNTIFPLFTREIFDVRFERQYSGNPPTEISWYACFNMILAIGCAMDDSCYSMTNISNSLSNLMSPESLPAKYLANATSMLIDLQFGHADLMSVQALVAMTVMLQGTSNPMATYNLVAIAARLGHAIGLHRWLDDFGLTAQQSEERRNVFWLLYIIDKNICIETGRPSAIHDQDIGIALPKEEPDQFWPNGARVYNTFLIWAKLSMVVSRVYSELYSTRSRTRTVLQRLQSIGKLDNELNKIRESIPLEIRPERKINCDERQLLPVILLHHSYYNCLTAIHRVSIYHGPWTSDPSDKKLPNHSVQLNPRVYLSEEICVAAARQAISTLDYLEQELSPMTWLAVSQPSSAALTLFANILQHPEDSNAAPDLALISRIISILGQMCATGRVHMATGALMIFQELYRIAQHFLATEMQAQAERLKEPAHNKVQQMVQEIENFSLPSDFRYPNQYSQDGTFNDNMLMLMGPQEGFPVDMGDHFTTPEGGWYNPRDVQNGFM
ncbi:fungal-specific transcription factor domain-containing protein [Bisporella sp. PMI_857]|nr:fungal-specific transcription factor domain-containing protein [Bisporella sp. PMI_857]